MNPTTTLNWGPVTPEGYDKNKNTALHVYNILMADKQIRKMAFDFIVAKVLLYQAELPSKTRHKIRIDIRGQLISFKNQDKFRDDLKARVTEANSNIFLEIEFLM